MPNNGGHAFLMWPLVNEFQIVLNVTINNIWNNGPVRMAKAAFKPLVKT